VKGSSAQRAKKPLAFFIGTLCLLVLANHATAISLGQIDDFENGTTMGWHEGPQSPNPPTNVSTGGPAGADDAFLRDVSNGSNFAGGRMVMLNTAQWLGSYQNAGVLRVTAQMANLGSTSLQMRIAIRNPAFTEFASTSAAALPADGVWRPVTFDLVPSTMTRVSGTGTLADVLANVAEVRILHSTAPAFMGSPISATLGVDNIRAVGTRITGIIFVGNVPQIRFATVTGASYRVERKNALTDPAWTALPNATSVDGTGGEVEVDDTEPGAGSLPSRFYRVVLL
jgi:hypothetical protein